MTSPAEPAPRAALITGASRGIGLAVARRLAAEGYALTLSARTPEPLEAAAAELAGPGTRVVAVPADAADPDALAALLARHEAEHGRLDALVLNAGMGFGSPIAETPLRRVDKHVALNFRGPFALVSAALPLLRRTAALDARGARIIALASLAGLMPEPDLAAYSATKAALVSLCESVCLEEGTRGVSATAICPGYVDTELAAWKTDEIPAEEMIRADDIAELAVALTRLSRHAAVPRLAVNRPGSLFQA
ncbi:SDR family oxidoreductase [Agromyces archimandritae]|uniref:SDR family oxidoreductase n=1 Tax=Agromyces archimandritae TaxID=2781962 RepID=A0A975FJS5_9MICO|nr:SDR family oxidoreductase [Agromyces archimandritae]QTX03795.1 SDR family oxidoreductase [Agromyces archimandritae]